MDLKIREVLGIVTFSLLKDISPADILFLERCFPEIRLWRRVLLWKSLTFACSEVAGSWRKPGCNGAANSFIYRFVFARAEGEGCLQQLVAAWILHIQKTSRARALLGLQGLKERTFWKNLTWLFLRIINILI